MYCYLIHHSFTGNIYVKTPDNVNVVEGEKLRIHCAVHGHPLPEISWIVHGKYIIAFLYKAVD